MQARTHQELYQSFIEFIANDIKRERSQVHRRILTVFLWCFFLPAAMSVTLLMMVKLGIVPRSVRSHLDWSVLIFPIFYSLYILGSEVLTQFPEAFRKGGGALTLSRALKEGKWRDQTIEVLEKAIPAGEEDWDWMIASFKIDLQALQYRTKYLTALAGAVFFLLMHGIDALTDDGGKVTWVKTSLLGWVDTSPNDLSQFVGLALFLVLLYLSGSQTNHALARYLNCAELILRSKKKR